MSFVRSLIIAAGRKQLSIKAWTPNVSLQRYASTYNNDVAGLSEEEAEVV